MTIVRTTEPTRSDEAYARIRTAIARGDLRPNERLVETELAEWLSISRTPIRESLQRLALEGLVVSRRRGWVVREPTREEIREIYEVRGALEGCAARLAAERGSDSQLARIAAIQHGAGEEAVRSPRRQLVDLNDAFHAAILDAAANERLAQLIRGSTEHFFNYRIANLYTDEEAQASLAGHERILAALEARDADRAERAIRQHIREALEVTLAKTL